MNGDIGSKLPYDVLRHCFAMVAISPIRDNGVVTTHRWESNEAVLPLLSVCRSWHAAAQDVLYASVSLVSRRGVTTFLNTLAAHTQLACCVRYLKLSLV
jgi:hypothetical protein